MAANYRSISSVNFPNQILEVRAEQIRLLYRSSPGIYLGGLFGLLLSVFLLRNTISHLVLAIWGGSFLLLTLLRWGLSLSYWRASPNPEASRAWGRRMVFGCFVSGVIWASASYCLYVPGSLLYQTYLILIICGLLAGSVSSLAVYMPAYMAFSFTTGLPFALRLIVGNNLSTPGGAVTFDLGMLLFAFMVVMFFFAVNTQRTIIESLLYRFRNLDLIETLKTQMEEIKQVNINLKQEIFVREQAEGRLQLTYKMMEHTAEGVMALDIHHIILWVNAAFSRLTGYNFSASVGKNFNFLLHDTTISELALTKLAESGHWEGEVNIKRDDDTVFPGYVSITVVPNEAGEPEHHVIVLTDFTQKKAQEANIRYLATHDTLTQLPNRAFFEGNLDAALTRARRHKNRVALLFIDLDQFKRINDALGHPVGDEILVRVAGRLRDSLRDADAVSRFGGDEFTIILEHFNEIKDVETVARKVCTSLSRPFFIDGHELVLTPSIGISLFPDDCDDAHTLVKYSDIAMYEVKTEGRNSWRFYCPDMTGNILEHLSLESALRGALKRHELQLYYQPRIDLQTRKIRGFEALLRWNHPQHGLLEPESFIALAEETGLILAMGEWVLAEASRQCRIWHSHGFLGISIAVNLSPRQFRDRGLIKTIRHILHQTELTPGYLELELTESAVMSNANDAIEVVKQLRELGVGVQIDDFGTGYSSLEYLKLFPIDAIKIDRSFIMNCHLNPSDAAITQAVIRLGHSLKLRVIAEGVENLEQLQLLIMEGCDEIQGYLYSKPLLAEETLLFLRNFEVQETLF